MKRSPINKVSKKQAVINRTQKEIRDDFLKEQIELFGFNFCQTCMRTFQPYQLDASHIIAKSRLGETTRENLVLECNVFGGGCHQKYEKNPESRHVNTVGYQKFLNMMGKT
jgi:hypothetical protein